MTRPTVFIGNESEDQVIAARIATDLRYAGVNIGRPFASHAYEQGPIAYKQHIESLLVERSWFLFVLTQAWVQSELMREEQAWANVFKSQGKVQDLIYFKAGSLEQDMSWLESIHPVVDGSVNYIDAVNGTLKAIGLRKPIFICYRRLDSSGHAGRLHDDLVRHFGEEYVFMDLTGIEPGIDFVARLDEAVSSCGVLLAVIGRSWLTTSDPDTGRRRLDDPEDLLRMEISTALRRGILVIPILVGGASMPQARQLPEDLQPLAQRNFKEITDSRWKYDVSTLVESLDRTAPYVTLGSVVSPEVSTLVAHPPADVSLNPEIAIEAARQHVLARKFEYDNMGNYVRWSDRLIADEELRKARLRKRHLSREQPFQVGDIVGRVDGHGTGVICAVDAVSADVSWHKIREVVHGYWTNPETIHLDLLDLSDAGPYLPPASGDMTTLQESDISMGRSLASAIQADSLQTPEAEIRWVPADRLSKAWEAGDIVRRYSRPAEPGASGVTFGQVGVICGGDKGVPEISWCYRDERGVHWQNPEVVPLTQLLWFTLVEKKSGAGTTRNV